MKKISLKITALLLGWMSFSVLAEQTVDIEIRGIKGERAIRNTDMNVKLIDKGEMDGSDRYKQLVSDAVDKGLRVFGYYGSSVTFELKKRKGQRDLLIANVTPGEPSKIAGTDVEITGEAAEDENFTALRKNLPKQGELVEHQKYDDYKSSISNLALARGYLKSGDPYLVSDLSELTNNFSSTNWFSSVLLQPHVREEDKLVDIELLLYPRKKNSMELGVGFATDTGPHVQIGWTKPWINSRGHSFRTNLYVSAPKQNFEATYKMPLLKNPLNYYYEFSTGYEKENKNDTDTKALTFAALRYWNNSEGWQYFAGLRVRYDSYTQADFTDKTFLVYPTGGFSRTRLRGGQFPTWGDTQKITVDLGNKLWMSDANFFKVQASTAWIRTYAENHRFITRAEIGYLNTPDIRKIPPALRFFAGGDRSVRGYGYKKISPKNKEGKLVGGSRLVTGSLEYQYQVYPNWWGAVFADTGLAADAYKANELRYGAGFGVRWASPVGAIKFDIATPIRDKDNSKNIQFYIGLGAEI